MPVLPISRGLNNEIENTGGYGIADNATARDRLAGWLAGIVEVIELSDGTVAEGPYVDGELNRD